MQRVIKKDYKLTIQCVSLLVGVMLQAQSGCGAQLGSFSTKCGASKGWYLNDGNCYYPSFLGGQYETATWHASKDKCHKLGAELTSVVNEEENTFITTLINQIGSKSYIWIGLSDFDGEVYKWEDGNPASYFNWDVGEPNNNNGSERCVITSRFGKWKDLACRNYKPFICKKKEGSSNYPITTVKPTFPQGKCPAKFVGSTKTQQCYHIGGTGDERDKKTFIEAIEACKKINPKSRLASLHSKADEDFVTAQLTDLNTPAWIGFRTDNKFPFSSDGFYWTDSPRSDYVNWVPGYPKDTHYQERCVNLLVGEKNAGLWKNIKCDVKLPYVCEFIKVSVTTLTTLTTPTASTTTATTTTPTTTTTTTTPTTTSTTTTSTPSTTTTTATPTTTTTTTTPTTTRTTTTTAPLTTTTTTSTIPTTSNTTATTHPTTSTTTAATHPTIGTTTATTHPTTSTTTATTHPTTSTTTTTIPTTSTTTSTTPIITSTSTSTSTAPQRTYRHTKATARKTTLRPRIIPEHVKRSTQNQHTRNKHSSSATLARTDVTPRPTPHNVTKPIHIHDQQQHSGNSHSSSGGLTGSEIVVVVVSVIALICIGLGAAYFLLRKKVGSQQSSNSVPTSRFVNAAFEP